MSIEQRDKTGLLENVSRNPLMEGLKIRADELLAPAEPGKEEEPRVKPDRDIYGPTPDVYGPPVPPPTRVERPANTGDPVTGVYGPPIPPAGSDEVCDARPGRSATVRLASTAPQFP